MRKSCVAPPKNRTPIFVTFGALVEWTFFVGEGKNMFWPLAKISRGTKMDNTLQKENT